MREQHQAQSSSSSRTQEPVLVYDGDCGFCTKAATWLVARGGAVARPAHTLDLSDEDAARSLHAAGWMVDGDLEVWGAPAIAAGLRHRGGASALVGWGLTLPLVRTVADLVYRWVARHRHRMPGATQQCRIDQEVPGTRRRARWLWLVVVIQVLLPLAALTHPPSRLGFQMYSGLGGTEVDVRDAEGERLPVKAALLPAPLRPDLPYAASLPEFLCRNVPGAATVAVRAADGERSVRC